MSTQKIPAAFRARGWRQWGQDGAVRLCPKDGPPSALVTRCEPRGWVGYVELGVRHLCDPAPTMLDAIARMEWAEAAGFFSPAWRGAPTVPTRPGWQHGVNDGLDHWEAAIHKPGWWSLRVELLRDRRYGPAITPVVSRLSGATSGDLCSSYALHDARRSPGGMADMVRHAMGAAEQTAQHFARRHGIPEVRLAIPHPESVRTEPANVEELLHV